MSQTLLEKLQHDEIPFEPASLTEEKKKEFRWLSLIAERFNWQAGSLPYDYPVFQSKTKIALPHVEEKYV